MDRLHASKAAMTHISEPVGQHDLSRAQYRFWIVGVARQGSLAMHWVGFFRSGGDSGDGHKIVRNSVREGGIDRDARHHQAVDAI